MSIIIQEIGVDPFPRYDAVPAWFEVETVFCVEVMVGCELARAARARKMWRIYDGKLY